MNASKLLPHKYAIRAHSSQHNQWGWLNAPSGLLLKDISWATFYDEAKTFEEMAQIIITAVSVLVDETQCVPVNIRATILP